MPNYPILSEFYNNTSFSAEENTSLKSSFLDFGQTFSIAINLLKKRLSSLFLPILVWQLVLFIGFLFAESILIFGIFKNIPQGYSIYIPNFNEISNSNTYEIISRVKESVLNLISLPSNVGFVGLMILIFVVYVLLSNWIQFKGSIMINDTGAKLFDGNNFVKRFWVLILFFIIESIIFQIVSTVFDIKGSAALSIILAVASFIFSFIITYLDIVAKYISYLYLIEKGDFWSSFKAMLGNTRNFLVADFLRHLIFGLIIAFTALVGVLLFAGLSIAVLLPFSDSNIGIGGPEIIWLILFAIILFLAIIFIIVLTWIGEAFLYVAYYNLRMLGLNNISNENNFSNSSKIVENSQSTKTLEEKLIQNIETKPNWSPKFVETETLANQNQEVSQEYNLMNVETIETKTEHTIINPNQSTTIDLKSTDNVQEVPTTTAFHKIMVDEDNLKIIEGIGPKIEEVLKNNNIKTFTQLADTSVEELNSILEKAGNRFSIHNPLNWSSQAVLARDGKMKELEILKEKLVRGL